MCYSSAQIREDLMGQIYVGVTVGDGKAIKEYAKLANDALASTAKAIIKKDSALTDKPGDGYVIRLKISAMTVEGGKVTVKIDGTIETTKKTLIIALNGNASGNGGKPEDLIKDCIDSVLSDLMPKAIKAIKAKAK
jgi:hypothetical protein